MDIVPSTQVDLQETANQDSIIKPREQSSKSITSTYLTKELVAFINNIQSREKTIPVGSELCHYFRWAQE